MKKLNGNTIGFIAGILFGVWHTVWAFLVMLGMAKPLLDFLYGIHFLNNPFMVKPFDMVTAVTLVVVTVIIGYVIGWAFAVTWNMLKK